MKYFTAHTSATNPMDHFVEIQEYVAYLEKDPAMAQRLREARARLAPLIFKPGEPRYERLMRGDGPTADTEARIAELEAALLDLYSGTAEYVYLNHLGDPHNTTPMRNAAKVLGAPALEAYDRLARLTAETDCG